MTCASTAPGANFANFAVGSVSVDARSVPWNSIGLQGERHAIRLFLEGPLAHRTAKRLARMLTDHEFAIPGLLVADLVIVTNERTPTGAILTLEALTLTEEVSPDRTPGSDRPAHAAIHPARFPTVQAPDAKRAATGRSPAAP